MTTTPVPDGRRLFGDFELDIANARLSRCGVPVELPPKSFALLSHLAQRPGELVLKDTLLDTVWGRRFVSEGAVKTVVSELRAALGDDARAPRWIETVQRRGYRFLGDVRLVGPAVVAPDGAAASTAPAATPAAAGARAAAPSDNASLRPGNLAPGLPPLVGREAELAQIDSLLAGGRLVTICGTAGVGKTSLALAAATQRQPLHAGGVWLAELAPLPTDATGAPELCAALARALQVPPAGMRDGADLVRAVQGLALLLVLDNAEHLVDTLAPLVAQLQRQLPLLHCLVTSREPLHIPGEQVLRLSPLSLPAADGDGRDADAGAMRFFLQRVATRLPGFEPVGAQRAAVARLCRALDGLPLALELAAARVPLLGVHGLVDHLLGGVDGLGDAGGDGIERPETSGARLQLLTQAPRTAQPHQRTLRAALDWSHMLLKPAEQQVFRRLAVFRGGFTLAAVQAVCADAALDAWAVLDALDALAGKSMVVAPRHDEPGARFALLESLREYAAERLQAAGEGQATARRHLRWMCAHWAAADDKVLQAPTLAWTAANAPELDNLRAALRWASTTLARQDDTDVADDRLLLVAHAAGYWQRAGLLAEGGQWCLAVRERAEAHPEPLRRAGIHLALAMLCRFTPLLPPAHSLALAECAAAVFAQAGDRQRAYYAWYLAWALSMEVDEARDRTPYLQAMQALIAPDWGPLILRYWRSAWSQDERLLGRHQVFLQTCREELGLFRTMGAHGESWSAGLGLMLAEHDQGDPARAIAVGRTLVDDIRAAGRMRTYAQLFSIYTTMVAAQGDVAAARRLLAEAVPMMPTMSACEVLLLALGWLASHEGRDATAARLLGWFDSPQRGGGSYGERTFTRRCANALAARLDASLGADQRRAFGTQAATLGDADAVRLGLQTEPTPERRRQPRTDENPTAS